MGRSVKAIFAKLARILIRVFLLFLLPITVILVLAFFPYDTDPPFRKDSITTEPDGYDFYNRVYSIASDGSDTNEKTNKYVEEGRSVAQDMGFENLVRRVVKTYKLQDKKVLDVGSGSGLLQDIVNDYTGLDIAPSAASYYHKPFVVASADSIPFPDNTFDAIWCIWVLEHVQNPEKVLLEMRRVLKPQGLLLLIPTWNCSPWASEGYEIRPYSDFGIRGKLVKATIPIMDIGERLARVPIRFCRMIQYKVLGEKTALRFRSLKPNYKTYRMPDSDAAISIDSYEVLLWFQSKGDQCLDKGNLFRMNKYSRSGDS